MSEKKKESTAGEPQEFDRSEEARKAWNKAAARMRVSLRKAHRLAHESARETAGIAVDVIQGHCNCGANTARSMLKAETMEDAAKALHRRARLAPRRCVRNTGRITRSSAKGALAVLREVTRGVNRALDAFGDMRVL